MLVGAISESDHPWAGAAVSHHAPGIRRVKWIKQTAKGEHYHFHFCNIANAPSWPSSPGKSKSISRLKKKTQLTDFVMQMFALWSLMLFKPSNSQYLTHFACVSPDESHHLSEFKILTDPLLSPPEQM